MQNQYPDILNQQNAIAFALSPYTMTTNEDLRCFCLRRERGLFIKKQKASCQYFNHIVPVLWIFSCGQP